MITSDDQNGYVRSGAENLDDDSETAELYPIPDDLLDRPLRPVETRFVLKPLQVRARIVVSAPLEADVSQAAYEAVLTQAEKSVPLRAARLRDLHERVEGARRRYRETQEREESLRWSRNQYANHVNTQINEELRSRRQEWELRRRELMAELEELERELLSSELPHQAEIADAEEAINKTRITSAERLDEAIHRAEGEVQMAQQAAIGRHQSLIDCASESLEATRRQKAEQLEQEAFELAQRARVTECCLLNEETNRSEEVSEARTVWAANKSQSQREVTEARRNAVSAAAAAGLLPTEAEGDCRAAVHGLLTEEAVCQGIEGDYPVEPHTKSVWSRRLSSVARTAALVASGSIFGISLGFITKILPDFASISEKPGQVLAVCTLGTFAFWLIEQLVHRTTSLASECFHAKRNDLKVAESWKFWAVPLMFAFLIIGGLIIVEMTVERFGIVGASIASTAGYQTGEINAPEENPLAYWLIALVVAAPFILFHAYGGWMDVRHRMARRRVKGLVATAVEERLGRPEFHGNRSGGGDKGSRHLIR